MKRTYSIATVSALILCLSFGISSAATPKVGAACSKLGMTAISSTGKITCVSMQKRLVWSAEQKGSSPSRKFTPRIPIKLPIPQSTEQNAITFANVLNHIDDIPTVAYQKVQRVIGANSQITVPNSVFVGPNTILDVTGGIPSIQSILSKEAQLWNGFSQPHFYSMYLYNAQDEKTTEDKFTSDFKAKGYDYSAPEVLNGLLRAMAGNCQQQVHPGAFTGAITSCTGANSGSYFKSNDSFLQLGQTGTSKDRTIMDGVVIAHEYAHSVQGAQWIDSPFCTNPDNFAPGCNRSGMSNHGFSPCWLMEGQPNAIGSAVAEKSLESYLSFRKQLPYGWGHTTITDYTEPSLKRYFSAEIQSPKTCYNNGQLYVLGYSIGALATETLVAIGGPQSTMALFALGGAGQDFSTAFKNVYGISWSDASIILSKVLAAEYATYGPAPK